MMEQQYLIDNVRDYLAKTKQPQVFLSRYTDVCEATASLWLSGKRHPNFDNMSKISKMLGISMAALLTKNGYKKNLTT